MKKRWTDYPFLNSCEICGKDITSGQQYRDGGYSKRAHEECAFADVTRRALVYSSRWHAQASAFDLLALIKVGAIDMDGWSPEDHIAARSWAIDEGPEEPPERVAQYIAKVKALTEQLA